MGVRAWFLVVCFTVGVVALSEDASAQPGAFFKEAPVHGAGSISTSLPFLTFTPSSDVLAYEVCIDKTNDGACEPWVSTNASGTFTRPAWLAPFTTYFWQVRARNAGGTTYADGAAHAFWSFTTGASPAVFRKRTPSDGAVDLSWGSVEIQWEGLGPNVNYQLCVDTTNDNTCGSMWHSVPWGPPGVVTTGISHYFLEPSTTYYWQVRSSNQFEIAESDGGAWFSFSTRPKARPDLNGDRWPDLLFQNQASGQTYVWLMGGPRGTDLVGEFFIGPAPTSLVVVAKDDFTGDGKADILWQDPVTTEVRLQEMDGLNPVADSVFWPASGPWRVAASGHLNLDGKPDLVWQHATTGHVYVWLMNGLTRIGEGLVFDQSLQPVSDAAWRVVALADFTGLSVSPALLPPDEVEEVLLQHSDGRVKAWSLRSRSALNLPGFDVSDSIALTGPTPWRIRMAADFDGDGWADILWQHPSGLLYVWFLGGIAPGAGPGSGWRLLGEGFVSPSNVGTVWRVVGGK